MSDPLGHMHGEPPERPALPDANRWHESRPFLRGVDLFNHGYYWEAHEAWEGLWHVCSRIGQTADFLRGLIKLAAAGVKAREGVPQGVASHAGRARAVFQHLAEERGDNSYQFGLRLGDLIAFSRAIEVLASTVPADQEIGPRIVFDYVLIPQATDEV